MATSLLTPPMDAFGGRRDRLQALRGTLACMRLSACHAAIPTGMAAIDATLPQGGVPAGALHEMAPSGYRDTPSAFGFLLALTARTQAVRPGPLVWILIKREMVGDFGLPYGPGFRAFGLDPGSFLLLRCRDRREALWAMEEAAGSAVSVVIGLRPRGLGLTESRRLHLAAERSGVSILLLRRHDDGIPSAAVTRWRVSSIPAVRDRFGFPALPRWRVALERCRGGGTGEWVVEWNALRLGLSPVLAGGASRARASA